METEALLALGALQMQKEIPEQASHACTKPGLLQRVGGSRKGTAWGQACSHHAGTPRVLESLPVAMGERLEHVLLMDRWMWPCCTCTPLLVPSSGDSRQLPEPFIANLLQGAWCRDQGAPMH